MSQGCFICANDCGSSTPSLINLTSKKYKTKVTTLIGDFISNDYELRITEENKICSYCEIILEKYDELKHETKIIKSVIGHQMSQTYLIETSEPMVYMDKSKVFTALPSNSEIKSKYSCRFCPKYTTDSLDLINTHCLYHKVLDEIKVGAARVTSEVAPIVKRNQVIKRQNPVPAQPERRPAQALQHPSSSHSERKLPTQRTFRPVPKPDDTFINIQQEYDEETLAQLIDLDLIEDPLCDSNLKLNTCSIPSCNYEFSYINEYVRHLRLFHQSTLNYIFPVIRASIDRPRKVDKLMCPYCFTKMSNIESLKMHIHEHEEKSKGKLFIDRFGEFVSNLMSSARCKTCDWEMTDPTLLDCSHEFAKNSSVPRTSCSYCSQEFYGEKLYHNHLALEHGNCFICGQESDDRKVLTDHIRSHLKHTEFSCQFCQDIYQTKDDRLEHMKLNHSENCCPHCDEWGLSKEEKEDHIRYAHADKRMEEIAPTFCDTCGASFKNVSLFKSHHKTEHQKKKTFSCFICKKTFPYLYVLLSHISKVHDRTVVDSESKFYKCFVCTLGFKPQERSLFVKHLSDHKTAARCPDCNISLDTIHASMQAHRERSHQDFSLLVDKKTSALLPIGAPKPVPKLQLAEQQEAASPEPAEIEQAIESEEQQFSLIDHEEQQQEIMVQTEDGSLLNMNNFILTENGEYILQNLDCLLPNDQAVADDSSGEQVHISNLEQFLLEQGLSSSTEISYIQQDENQVIVQNEDGTVSQSSQDSLVQTYDEIFQHDDDIPTEFIVTSEINDENIAQNLLLNGDFLVQSVHRNGNIVEQVETKNAQTVDANQSTLDELGDILLEVAAAAEKEKKPKDLQQNLARESLWGAKRQNTTVSLKQGAPRKRAAEVSLDKFEQPASNFSQAYEFFVKGFDAKKQKQM